MTVLKHQSGVACCTVSSGIAAAGTAAEESLLSPTADYRETFASCIWNDHDMILAVPLHVGLATPVFSLGSSVPLGAFPESCMFRERRSLVGAHQQSWWFATLN